MITVKAVKEARQNIRIEKNTITKYAELLKNIR